MHPRNSSTWEAETGGLLKFETSLGNLVRPCFQIKYKTSLSDLRNGSLKAASHDLFISWESHDIKATPFRPVLWQAGFGGDSGVPALGRELEGRTRPEPNRGKKLAAGGMLETDTETLPKIPGSHSLTMSSEVQPEITNIQQTLRDYLQQVESCLNVLQNCAVFPQAPSTKAEEIPPEREVNQEDPGPPSPETPGVALPDPNSVMAERSSSWPQPPPEADRQQSPSSPWNRERPSPWDEEEPLFWRDVLTKRLWQVLVTRAKKGEPRVSPGLEEKDPGRWDSEAKAGTTDSSFPSHAELTISQDTGPCGAQQEPAGRALSFLKPISWDPEDFEDTWERPDALPWQSKRFAIPHWLQKKRVLAHGERVLAVAVSSFMRHAFTCGRQGIKVWSLARQVAEDHFPASHLRAHRQTPRAYLRTCLLSSNSRMLLAGGHGLACVSAWDLAAPCLHLKAELPCAGLSCQALASDLDENFAFASFTDGTIRLWDLRDQTVVRDLMGQPNGAKSMVVRGHNMWTGGMDTFLRHWDLRMTREAQEFPFEAQIMSLSYSPLEDWVLLGLANGQHWLQHTRESQTYMAGRKDSGVLGLKFSPYGQWWASVGLDNLVTVHSLPWGVKEFQVSENSIVTCCDVSSDNHLIVTGSGDNASVYQVTY